MGENLWQKPFKYITIGFGFSLMSIDHWYLNAILPVIGAALLYYGFREIKEENNYFKWGYIFSIIGIIYKLILVVIVSSPLNITTISYISRITISLLFTTIFLVIFRCGVKELFKTNGLILKRSSLGIIILVNILMYFMVFVPFGAVFILIFYVCILNSIYKISRDLKEVPLKATTKKLSFRVVLIGYIIVSSIVFGITSTLSNHLIIKGTEYIKPESTEVRETLIFMGFPSEALELMSDEELEYIKYPIKVESQSETLMFDPKETSVSDGNRHEVKNEKGDYNLECTTIFVESLEDKIHVIQYFNWVDGGAYFNDGFSLTGSASNKLISGKLFWNEGEAKLTSDIPRLTSKYDGSYQWTYGGVSYPYKSTNQRGYVFSEIISQYNSPWSMNVLFNYTHYNNPFRYNYTEPENNRAMFDDNKQQSGGFYRTVGYGQ